MSVWPSSVAHQIGLFGCLAIPCSEDFLLNLSPSSLRAGSGLVAEDAAGGLVDGDGAGALIERAADGGTLVVPVRNSPSLKMDGCPGRRCVER